MSSDALKIFNDALAMHQAGRLDEAARRYRFILSFLPALGDGLNLLGLLTRRRGDERTGMALMRRALLADPLLGPAAMNYSAALQEQGRLDEVEPVLRRMAIGDPATPTAFERLARLRLLDGRIDEAERLLRRGERLGGGERIPLMLERCRLYRQVAAAALDPALEPGIVVRGAFRDSSGYAHKVRQFVRHLVAAGIRVWLLDLLYMPTDDLTPGQLDPLFATLDRPVRARAAVSFTTPAAVEPIPGLLTVNYSVFEAARIPPLWVRHSLRHDRTIVATESSRRAWVESGVPDDRVLLCPEGVEPVAPGSVAPLDLQDSSGRRLFDHRVRVLNISDFNPRKNLVGLLRVWLRATRAGDGSAIVIKIGKGDDAAPLFAATVRRVSEETGVALEEAGTMFLMDGKYSDREMLSLAASCTHYWSMSHGEGWDLPMAQAGAMGLTLLAPAHSAYTAYLDPTVAHMIPSTRTPAFGGYDGLDWWSPDEDAAVELLSRIVRDPEGNRRSARRHLLDRFGWDRAAARLIGILEEEGAL